MKQGNVGERYISIQHILIFIENKETIKKQIVAGFNIITLIIEKYKIVANYPYMRLGGGAYCALTNLKLVCRQSKHCFT